MIWAKIIGGLLALALLAGAAKWASNTLEKARGYEAAVASADQAQAEKVALAESFAKSRTIDVDIGAMLSGFRGELAAQSQTFHDSLTRKPLTLEVAPHVDPTTGIAEPCRVRDAHRYRCLHNVAVSGITDPDCVL